MKEILCREFTRRTPFAVERLPWIARMYRYPFDKWTAVGRQGLFGAPNYLLFYLYQKLFPLKILGAFHYSIGSEKKLVRFDTKSTHFRALYSKMFSAGYEPHLSALIDVVVPAKGIFYDVGSNWGWFTLLLASRPDFQGRIHAFEPCPPTFADLTSVVKQAGLEDRVTCHDLALLDKAGSGSIHLPDHIHRECAVVVADEQARGGMSIHTTTLDLFSGEPPDVMKVDVEGVEHQVFIGGKELLRKQKPIVIFENHRDPANLEQTMQPILDLESFGYQFYHVAWLRKLGQTWCLVGDDCDPNPQPKEILALVPFESSQRFLLHKTMNIFACHRDKVGMLEACFERKQL
jgi:FkbM family methyltransferase